MVKGFNDPIEDVVLLFYLYNYSHLAQLSKGLKKRVEDASLVFP